MPRTSESRNALPATRQSLTHKFRIANQEGYLTLGMHEDGSLGEIFIKVSKEGSTVSGLCQAFCRSFSLAMQFGLTVDEAVTRFKGMRFEPRGETANPDIPSASSIIDYVVRFIELQQLPSAASRTSVSRTTL